MTPDETFADLAWKLVHWVDGKKTVVNRSPGFRLGGDNTRTAQYREDQPNKPSPAQKSRTITM